MARDRESRLVYSTGGQVPPPEKVREAQPARDQPSSKGIRLRLERRASGRLVTLVTGAPGPSPEVEALGRELRTRCGTGGTTRDGTIELQGDHREKVEALLAARGLRSRRAG